MCQAKEGEQRYRVSYLKGENGDYPHVVDTKDGGERIVSFGRVEGSRRGDQLFLDPEEAESAAELLNAGESPEDIKAVDFGLD